MMVNEGMKSKPGNISSMKLNIPPITPFFPPNILYRIHPDIGAQITSAHSPKPGSK